MATTNSDTNIKPVSSDIAAPWGKNRKGKPLTEAQYKAKLKAKQKAKYQAAAHRVTRICPQCHKLCSLEGADPPEVDSEEIDDTTLRVTVGVILNSACCGDEVARQDFEIEVELDDEHVGCPGGAMVPCEDCDGDGEEDCGTCEGSGSVTKTDGNSVEVEVDCPDCEGSGKVGCSACDGTGEMEAEPDEPYDLLDVTATYAEDYDNLIKQGPRKGQRASARYSTTLRGAEIEAEVKCNKCDETFTITHKEMAPASTFENSN